MDEIGRIFNLGFRYVFEPSLNWVLDHPIILLVVVGILVFWCMRGYRML